MAKAEVAIKMGGSGVVDATVDNGANGTWSNFTNAATSTQVTAQQALGYIKVEIAGVKKRIPFTADS